jgi:hypothetical protein
MAKDTSASMRTQRGTGVWSGSFCLLIDGRLRDFRQGLVCGLFLGQGFLEQFARVIKTKFFRPGL